MALDKSLSLPQFLPLKQQQKKKSPQESFQVSDDPAGAASAVVPAVLFSPPSVLLSPPSVEPQEGGMGLGGSAGHSWAQLDVFPVGNAELAAFLRE